jgi:hypothetical protein
MTIKMKCNICGGFDECELNGTYVERHECLHPNIILLQIADSLALIAERLKNE